MSGKFNRRHEVAIRIGADSWADVISVLRQLIYIANTKGPGHDLVSGGSTSSYVFVDQTSPDITHASYFAEVDAWIDAVRQEKKGKDEAIEEIEDIHEVER